MQKKVSLGILCVAILLVVSAGCARRIEKSDRHDISPYFVRMTENWATEMFLMAEGEPGWRKLFPPPSNTITWRAEFDEVGAVHLAVYADMLRGAYNRTEDPSKREEYLEALVLFRDQLKQLLDVGKQSGSANTKYVEAALASTQTILLSVQTQEE
jgi:hypothetical protein